MRNVCLVALALMAGAWTCLAQTSAVEAEGKAEDRNEERAHRAAQRDAEAQALKQVMAAWPRERSQRPHYPRIEEQLLSEVARFVRDVSVVKKSYEKRVSRVTIKATVAALALEAQFQRYEAALAKAGRPKVLVVVAVTMGGKPSAEAQAVETGIVDYLQRGGFAVIALGALTAEQWEALAKARAGGDLAALVAAARAAGAVALLRADWTAAHRETLDSLGEEKVQAGAVGWDVRAVRVEDARALLAVADRREYQIKAASPGEAMQEALPTIVRWVLPYVRRKLLDELVFAPARAAAGEKQGRE